MLWFLGSGHLQLNLCVYQVGDFQCINITIMCGKALLCFEFGSCRARLGERSSTREVLCDLIEEYAGRCDC